MPYYPPDKIQKVCALLDSQEKFLTEAFSKILELKDEYEQLQRRFEILTNMTPEQFSFWKRVTLGSLEALDEATKIKEGRHGD